MGGFLQQGQFAAYDHCADPAAELLPAERPAVQTLRWVFRPLAFMESARRRFGDAFSVRFTGFESPMVMLSDPEVQREVIGIERHA